jgi:hypothetical protein
MKLPKRITHKPQTTPQKENEMSKKKEPTKASLPNYFEVNTWMVHDACSTMDEAMAMIGIIARSSDRITQQALFGVLTVLVDSQRTLGEYLEGPENDE